MDVYADQYITTGGHHSHEVGEKKELKVGEKITHRTKVHQVSGSKKVSLTGPSGMITIDSGGITLKGNVKIKGNLSITSGSPEAISAWKAVANTGEAICWSCLFPELGG